MSYQRSKLGDHEQLFLGEHGAALGAGVLVGARLQILDPLLTAVAGDGQGLVGSW
jgi:hypothetical protein